MLSAYFETMAEQRRPVYARLANVSAEALWQRPGNGTWSIGEHLEHLVKVLRLVRRCLVVVVPVEYPVARLVRRRPYVPHVDDLFEGVGLRTPPGLRPKDRSRAPIAFETMRETLDDELARLSRQVGGLDADTAGHIKLWHFMVGRSLNVHQFVQLMGCHHEAHHFASIKRVLLTNTTPHPMNTTTTAQTIKTAFERNEKAMRARPAIAQKQGRVKVRTSEGLRCKVSCGPWSYAVDMAEQVGGTATAPTPGIYEASALGSCIAIMVRLWAAKYDVEIGAIDIDVEFEADKRFLFDVGDVPARWTTLGYRIAVESDAPEADVMRVLDMAHAQSHVRGDFEHPHRIEREVELVAPA